MVAVQAGQGESSRSIDDAGSTEPARLAAWRPRTATDIAVASAAAASMSCCDTASGNVGRMVTWSAAGAIRCGRCSAGNANMVPGSSGDPRPKIIVPRKKSIGRAWSIVDRSAPC